MRGPTRMSRPPTVDTEHAGGSRILDAAEVARMLGVSRSRVGELAAERDFFLPNVGPAGNRVWLWDLLVRWAAGHPDQRQRGPRPVLPVYGQLAPVAERILELARIEARALNHYWIGYDHVLLGLLSPSCPGAAPDVLQSLGVSADEQREAWIESMGDPFEPLDREPELSLVGLMLRQANCEAAGLQDPVVQSEHVLLALAAIADVPPLGLLGLDRLAIRGRVLAVTEGVVPSAELPIAAWARPRPRSAYAGPDLAPSPAGHDPLRRRPWGSRGLPSPPGEPVDQTAATLHYLVDRDGHPLLTTDGRPLRVASDDAGRHLLNEEGSLFLEAFEVPPGV